MDIAALGFKIDSGPARTAATDLAKLNDAAVKASSGADKLNKILRDSRGRFRSSYDVARQYGSEVRSLADKYNPVLSAVYKYQAAQEELNRAVALGVVTQGQADAALSNLQTSLARGSVASSGFSKGMEVSTHHATNLTYQLNDIGMMMMSGQSPFMLMLQQGPQVSQIFSAMSAEGKKIGPTLASAFTSLLNPMSMLTLGVIAGGAALVQWGMDALGASEKAKTVKEAVDELSSSVSSLNNITKVYSAEGIAQAIEKYGTLNAETLRMIELQKQLQIMTSMNQVRDVATAIGDELDTFFGGIAKNADAMFKQVNNSFGSQFERTLSRIKDANTFEEQLAAVVRLREMIEYAARSTGGLTREQAELLAKVVETEDALRQLANAAPKANWMSAAISGVQALGVEIRNRINEAVRLRGLANAPGMTTGDLSWAKTDLGFTLGGNELLGLPEPKKTGSSGAGKGGGGKGGGGTDQYADNLTRLMESLRTERETVDAWYHENLTILNDRRAQEILGEQAHKEAMLDLEQEYLDRKSKLNSGYDQFTLGSAENLFGELYSLSGSSYDGLLKLQKTFGAAQALVNTYTAASQVLADPELGFFAKFAAVAKTVAAGMGLVNAIKGGGSGGGGGASATTSATSGARSEPERVTRVELQGEDWLVSLAETMMSQIYNASKNGRVIVARA